MKCNLEAKKSTYGHGVFCKTCGMDIELNPIRIKHRGITLLYCCEDCAKSK